MYFLIGGGEIRNLETLQLDSALVEYSEKKTPNFLFIPTASHDSAGYIQAVKSIYKDKLKCEYDFLSLSEKPDKTQIQNKIENADIIYVGGGDTKYLMDKWKEYNLDKILLHYKDDKILTGLSAGSICWFEKGISDTASFAINNEKWQYSLIDGLGFLPGIHSPHLDEREREAQYTEFTSKHNVSFIGIENNCALVINKDEYWILRSNKNKNAYMVNAINGVIRKEMIPDKGKIKAIFK